jgi:hypothetical protein
LGILSLSLSLGSLNKRKIVEEKIIGFHAFKYMRLFHDWTERGREGERERGRWYQWVTQPVNEELVKDWQKVLKDLWMKKLNLHFLPISFLKYHF